MDLGKLSLLLSIFTRLFKSINQHLKLNFLMIRQILTPALKLWLYSQVEQADDLKVNITGSDRQILRGYIPRVSLNTSCAVYQSLHLGEVRLTGDNIRVNLPQVLKGKALQLLEPITVSAHISLTEAQLQASLDSPLLSVALKDFLAMLLKSSLDEPEVSNIISLKTNWDNVTIGTNELALSGNLVHGSQGVTPIKINAGLKLSNGNQLNLTPLQIVGIPEVTEEELDGFNLDLGSDVEINSLSLTSGKLLIEGKIMVRP